MSDEQLMTRLNDIERDIGSPGFWDRAPDVIRPDIAKHGRLLKEAVGRGLTRWDRSDHYGE